MSAPTFIGEHTLGRNASGGDARLVAFELANSVEEVTYTSDEVSSYCPVTGQPDFYTVAITVWGSLYGIESKSLKLYLQAFNDKDKAQFAEQFAHTIAQDVLNAFPTSPWSITVLVTQKPRGGVAIKARAHYSRGKDWKESNQ